MKKFSHINAQNQPKMVDVSTKAVTARTATAQAIITLNDEIMAQFKANEIHSKKGPVFQTAIIAGIQAVKKTSELIPMCHPLSIDGIEITLEPNQNSLYIRCTVSVEAKTGVEMEALTGASVTALTVYDMCKSFSHNLNIKEVKLIEKKGGKSDIHQKISQS
ncbi:cyclic pyranopterin monophosphate synthase MoaC [Flavobacteriaceae bacterium F08102]|nr:cyclic pyranopterin monophosphate synthase MoaC [Flavobacteriaceae bacterium F08102]